MVTTELFEVVQRYLEVIVDVHDPEGLEKVLFILENVLVYTSCNELFEIDLTVTVLV
jgi:hypothetical protein